VYILSIRKDLTVTQHYTSSVNKVVDKYSTNRHLYTGQLKLLKLFAFEVQQKTRSCTSKHKR